ncbi:uncharacterized protein [Aristolochia californica]|uniref:uncharacterized protein n=1 Tax=Aristolochia californica TaxID=171875 RepID=UPI0035D62EB1
MENITASEVAGFGVGALLFFATVAATKVDSVISASQRSSLGMCKRCGDLKMIACSRCRGAGLVKGGPFNFILIEDVYEWLGGETTRTGSISCTKCQARGRLKCPDCS